MANWSMKERASSKPNLMSWRAASSWWQALKWSSSPVMAEMRKRTTSLPSSVSCRMMREMSISGAGCSSVCAAEGFGW